MRLGAAFAGMGLFTLFVIVGLIAAVSLFQDTAWPSAVAAFSGELIALLGVIVFGVIGAVLIGVTKLFR